MFNNVFEDLSYALGVLSQEKILYDFGAEILGSPIDSDFLYENYIESMERCADDVYMTYDEERECEVTYFIDKGITNFFCLAHRYGARHHIHAKDNPWLKKAFQAVHDEMYSIDSYSYDWQLFDKRKKNMPICFVFYAYPEFYQPVQALQAITGVLSFFREAASELKKELCETGEQEDKLIRLTTNQDNRKAA